MNNVLDLADKRRNILTVVSAEELAIIRSVLQVLAPRVQTSEELKILRVKFSQYDDISLCKIPQVHNVKLFEGKGDS